VRQTNVPREAFDATNYPLTIERALAHRPPAFFVMLRPELVKEGME